jgi:hypothetical protein
MRTLHTLCSVLLLAAGTAWSADLEMDTDWMQAIEDANKSLSSNIALKNAKAATADAQELNAMFVKVEAFFAAKADAHDAVDLSRKSIELTGEISKSISASDYDAATNSATALSRTCRTCHTFYKKS